MSLSLISRRLHALKLAQRTVSPLAASTRASAIAVAMPRIPAAYHDVAPAHLSTPADLRTPIRIDIARAFSSADGPDVHVRTPAGRDVVDDDDGGPVGRAEFKSMSNRQLADMSTVPGWNLVHNPPRRNPRGALVGKVVSDKMQKTVNVAVDRFKMLPKYRKRWRFTRKFMAHDEHEVCNVGDLVMIVPCQRISRHKHFMVREIIRPKGQL